MNITVCVVCTVLMVLGASELVRLIGFWWSRPLTDGWSALVIEPGSAEECEAQVRAAAERIRWMDRSGPCELLCLNPSGDGEIDRICRAMQLRYPFLRVCKPADLMYNLGKEERKERDDGGKPEHAAGACRHGGARGVS